MASLAPVAFPLLLDLQMRTVCWNIRRRGDSRLDNLTGKDGYLLSLRFRKNIVANDFIVVRDTSLTSLQVCPVGIVSQMANLNARCDKLIDGDIHLELQEGRNIYVGF